MFINEKGSKFVSALQQIFNKPSTSVTQVTQDHFYNINVTHDHEISYYIMQYQYNMGQYPAITLFHFMQSIPSIVPFSLASINILTTKYMSSRKCANYLSRCENDALFAKMCIDMQRHNCSRNGR